MKLKHLHVKNIRSYKELDIDFSDGVTVISGANGSGKSSILEACFMALFGTNALSGTELQLADMVCKGASSAEIFLDFDHTGNRYRIEQQFRVSKTGAASNSKSVLYKNGEVVTDQSKKTYAAVKELLNMDEKAYENCAYIRQGEVDALINAKPKERQKMIDDLLCLGKLEEYRERAAESLKAVNRLSRRETEKFADLSERVSVFRAANLPEKLNGCQTSRQNCDLALGTLEKKKDEMSAELVRLGEKIRLFGERETEMNDLRQALKETEIEKMQAIGAKDAVLETIAEKERKAAEMQNHADTVFGDVSAFLKAYPASEFEELFADGDADLSGTAAPSFDVRLLTQAVRSAENRVREKKQAASEKKASSLKLKEEAAKTVADCLSESEDIRKQTALKKEQIIETDEKIRQHGSDIDARLDRLRDVRDRFVSLFRTLCPDASFTFKELETVPAADDPASQDKWLGIIDESNAFVQTGLRAEEAALSDVRTVRASLKSETDEKKKASGEDETALRQLISAGEQLSFEIERMRAEIGQITGKKKDLLFLKSEREKEKEALVHTLSDAAAAAGVDAPYSSFSDRTALDGFRNTLSDRRTSLESTAASLKATDDMILGTIEKYEDLIRAGKCPTCGRPVDEAHAPFCLQDESKKRAEIAASLAENKHFAEKTAVALETAEKLRALERIMEEISGAVAMTEAELSGKNALIEKYGADMKENGRKAAELKARIEAAAVEIATSEKRIEEKDVLIGDTERALSEKEKQAELLASLAREISRTVSAVRTIVPERAGLLGLKEAKEREIADLNDRLNRLSKKTADASENVSRLEAALSVLTREEEQSAALLAVHEKAVRDCADLDAARSAVVLLKTEAEGLKASYENIVSVLREKDRSILEKKERIRVLSEALGKEDADSFRKRSDELNAAVSVVFQKAEECRADKSALLEQIGFIQGEIRQWHAAEDDMKKSENKIGYLSLVLEDVRALEAMYMRIRTELRSRNIRALDTLLNDMFSFIYTNNAYSRIELDADYNLKVYEKNGVILEPRLLSGGERALFNLALRCAIYRFLSYGLGERGGADLPPMILDEPTVFLDSGHIRQLIRLIDRMKDLGVGQIIVVSHDESLIDSADRVYTVTKDSLTNTSSFEEFVRGAF